MSWCNWWRVDREEGEVALREAERAVSAIFSPSHSVMKKSPDVTQSILRRSGVRLFSGAKGSDMEEETGEKKAVSRPSSPIVAGSDEPPSVSIPPCPIAGYSLLQQGLVDNLATPPRTLSVNDLRLLISELASIEQRARYEVDTQLAEQVHGRGRRGLELVVNPCLYLGGLYLMMWKGPRLYHNASPRGSVFFTQLLAMLRWHIPEVEKERLSQKHRVLLQVTNARVALTFLAGLFAATVAYVTQPPLDVVDTGPDVEFGKNLAGYQHHTETALRWLWLVYYHHPAYRALTMEMGRSAPHFRGCH
ncbi:hypothetical protein ERJ75_000423900 [Trypanosoma vivax]|uniref:Uncharacterized protein n=1 Tax=Trypanosoma vivax (strain Y486) TaxID=1055687 RepID=G0U1K4_TRYVY|nr:hypothetical protein TRVL_00985 [Trypanosoma vivax]KAH8616923.1 hypothetical protein ERJ75_000423900 [Trypanosoma vivax]CCC49961.1 conserved hypothetical protein [Trypanosoma vivax Y486]